MFELLPIGSIVKVKDINQNLMIIGYNPDDITSDELNDYIGLLGRNGLTSKNYVIRNKNIFHFKKSDIENVMFIGYQDEEFFKYEFISKKVKGLVEEVRRDVKPENYAEEFIKRYKEMIGKNDDE